MTYLKVYISSRHGDEIYYTPLDPITEYTEKDLEGIAQTVVDEAYSWGYESVDESEVPESDK